MRKFFTGAKGRLLLALLAALLIGVAAAAVSSNGVSPVSAVLSVVLKPLDSASAFLRDRFSDLRLSFRSADRYREEAESLRAQLEAAREQLVEQEKLKQKLAAYESFLDVKSDNPDYTFIPASVVLRDPSDLYGSFTVDRGSSDGVHVNDPVIYGQNLVGVVKEAAPDSAVVYTLFHPSVNVSAYEIRTREDCYTEPQAGAAAKGVIRAAGFTRTGTVSAGGIVCSSGVGGIFPRDLIIGTVQELAGSEGQPDVTALIAPNVSPETLTDVFILTSFEGKAG